MPASRSARRVIERPRPPRRWPLILLVLIAVSVAAIFVLPASLAGRFLPPQVRANDFSGSLLHGAAGKLKVNGHDAGAVEWQVHPLALLRLAVVADIHWVKIGFVIDGTAEVGRSGVSAHDIKGGGPLENLSDLGFAAGWHGKVNLSFSQIKSDFRRLQAAVGNIAVADISSASIAAGADLGSYVLQLAPDSVAADGSLTAQLKDNGGPVEAQAQIQFSPAMRTGLLSGTLKERPDASPALLSQLNTLSQIRPRDSAGRFPVELEFTF
ncbi:MAG TPA: type II secretion system protein N [Steroidobacteraceae bacterium]|jgi:hypothetical protein|nr:type II secretion system protein N [Steroidobacteraceae bacterium]